MGKTSRTVKSPFLAILVLSVLLMKLILAAQSLFTPDGMSGLLAVPEALAKEQKADLVTGDAEFKQVEGEIRIGWL